MITVTMPVMKSLHPLGFYFLNYGNKLSCRNLGKKPKLDKYLTNLFYFV